MTISEADWSAATDALAASTSTVVACHIHPDGDALGSALALQLALARAGHRAVASFSEPFVVAPQYRFLPGVDGLVAPDAVPEDPDVFICFDAGSLDRLGTLAPAFEGARQTIVVDHHASNSGFGHHNLIDPQSPASAVLARELISRLGLTLDADVATLIYTGLVTDTGRFQYHATTAETHELAAELLRAGVRPDVVSQQIYDSNAFGYLGVLGACLARAEQVASASLVWTSVQLEDLRRHGIGMEEAEGVIDAVRTDRQSQVAAVCKQQVDGGYKVSLRSRGQVDVGKIAAGHGGGGHAYAAGYTSDLDLEGTVKQLVAALSG